MKDDSIITIPKNKRNGIVIWDQEDYLSKYLYQLDNEALKKLKTIQLKQQARIIHPAGSMVAECYHLDLTDEQ